MTRIADIVDTAVRLHDAERDVLRWEGDLEILGERLTTVPPCNLAKVIERIGVLNSMVDVTFHSQMVTGAIVRAYGEAEGEIAEITSDHKARHDNLAERTLALRRQMRELHGRIGDVVAGLRDQSIVDRLQRVLPKDGAEIGIDAVNALVAADHEAVADAIAAWRTMNNPHPIFLIVGSTSASEVREGLASLVRTGRLAQRRTLSGLRWTLRDAERRAA